MINISNLRIQVVFGGDIAIGYGEASFDSIEGYSHLSFKDLKDKKEIGEMYTTEDVVHAKEITLLFKDIKSVDVLIETLNKIRTAMLEKKNETKIPV